MSSSTSGTMLPHRSIASIKSPTSGTGGGPSSPHTPLRTIASNFGSPSSLRAEEDILILEFGCRKVQVGFAGDPVPRGQVWFGPDQLTRVGDFSHCLPDYREDWRTRAAGARWGKDHELWQPDLRDQDLGLVEDKIERALREAFTKYELEIPFTFCALALHTRSGRTPYIHR
jgi:hypothetical protein